MFVLALVSQNFLVRRRTFTRATNYMLRNAFNSVLKRLNSSTMSGLLA